MVFWYSCEVRVCLGFKERRDGEDKHICSPIPSAMLPVRSRHIWGNLPANYAAYNLYIICNIDLSAGVYAETLSSRSCKRHG